VPSPLEIAAGEPLIAQELEALGAPRLGDRVAAKLAFRVVEESLPEERLHALEGVLAGRSLVARKDGWAGSRRHEENRERRGQDDNERANGGLQATSTAGLCRSALEDSPEVPGELGGRRCGLARGQSRCPVQGAVERLRSAALREPGARLRLLGELLEAGTALEGTGSPRRARGA
jgi:hypothetical protein